MRLVLRLTPRGFLVGGPPCGSWVFINRSTSKRSRTRIFGNLKHQYVQDSNVTLWPNLRPFCAGLLLQCSCARCSHMLPRITARWVLLGLLSAARDVCFITEQPQSSLMPHFPYFRYMAMVVKPLPWKTTSLWEPKKDLAQVDQVSGQIPRLCGSKSDGSLRPQQLETHHLVWYSAAGSAHLLLC